MLGKPLLVLAAAILVTPSFAAPQLAPGTPISAFKGGERPAFVVPELAPGMVIGVFLGTGREYTVSDKADYANESFRAEATLTLRSGQGGNGSAFFGLGKGTPNPANFNEPTTAPSLVFRLAPSDFAGGQVNAALNGEPTGETAALGDGTHRLRFSWDAKRKHAWLELHPNWKPGDTFAAKSTLSVDAGNVQFGKNSHLFVGGSGGVEFSDFSAKALTAEDLSKLPLYDTFPKDASAGTWLPVAGALAGSNAAVNAFLKDVKANVRPLVCWYKGAQLEASRPLTNGKLALANSTWDPALEVSPVAGDLTARDLTLRVSLKEGGALSAGIAAAFDFSDWSTENYVLIPGAVYNGNRYRTVSRGYAAGLAEEDHYRKDLPLTQSDVPRLATESGAPSKLEVAACNVTTPAVCIFDKKAKRGFIVLAEQAGRGTNGDFLRKANGELIDNAFAVEESPDRSRATVVVSAPGVRSRKPEFIGFSGSPDRGIAMKAGDSVTLKLRVYDFPADGIPAVLEKFMAVRKAVTGPNHPRDLVPASQVEKYMTACIDGRFLTSPNASFYCPENGPWIAFGWIGGWMNTFPMLVLGDQTHLERVAKTFDHGLKAQEPSGWFHYAIDANGNTTFRDPGKDCNLSRSSGDMLYWMIKQFELLKAQGRADAIKPEWEQSMKRLADAMVATWKKDGQWGKLVNVKTGDVAEYNTTGGAMCVGALALASEWFKNPEYLAIAKAAADYYYKRDFVAQGQTTGACADILQNAESETAYGFTTALMALYEVTGEKTWLEKSRNLANLAATWTVSYDYELPKNTELGSLDAKLAGVVWASTQNKHGAPGSCTAADEPLFKIYRATGDERYAAMMRDVIAAHGESIRPDGRTNERLTYCDADSRGSRGSHVTGWNETNGVMMAQEVPGIYLRTDTDRFYVFDSVEAEVVSRGADGVRVEIKNPTKFDAKVSVFAENGAQSQKPLGQVALLKWPKIEVKAGETKTFTVTPEGTLR
jgi:hypothetical protein